LKRTGRFGDSRGFSLMQMVVTASVISVIMTAAVLGLRSARAAMRLNNSARVFAQNVERARIDAIRRHDQANIEFTSPTTYEITMDFVNNGDRQTRQFTLDGGVELVKDDGTSLLDAEGNLTAALPYADFNWRGRTDTCSMSFPMKNSQGNMLKVQVAGSGDITVNSSVSSVPTVTYSNVSATADIAPSTAITGTDTKLNLSPCDATTTATTTGGTTTTTTTVPPPVAVCSTGGLSLNKGLITVRRNGASSDTVAVTVGASGTIVPVVPSNLTLTPSSSPTVPATTGGTVTYTVRSNNKTRGTFAVKFTFSNCTPATLNVKVIN
jgi:Tfp pilus assembly protein FimT